MSECVIRWTRSSSRPRFSTRHLPWTSMVPSTSPTSNVKSSGKEGETIRKYNTITTVELSPSHSEPGQLTSRQDVYLWPFPSEKGDTVTETGTGGTGTWRWSVSERLTQRKTTKSQERRRNQDLETCTQILLISFSSRWETSVLVGHKNLFRLWIDGIRTIREEGRSLVPSGGRGRET